MLYLLWGQTIFEFQYRPTGYAYYFRYFNRLSKHAVVLFCSGHHARQGTINGIGLILIFRVGPIVENLHDMEEHNNLTVSRHQGLLY